jgi:hypothetical protein
VNCQRQRETCDYSIRLNWGGRGNKKPDSTVGSGQIDFSSGIISVTPISRPSTGESVATPTTLHSGVQESFFARQPTSTKSEKYDLSQPDSNSFNPEASQPVQHPASLDGPYEASMIDPALVGSASFPKAMYQDSLYSSIHGRPEPQYTQSHERYRSLTPTTPGLAPVPAVSRLRQLRTYEDSASPIDSGVGSPSASTFSNRSTTLSNMDSPTRTPPFYGNTRDEGDISLPELASYDRPQKRMRYQAGQDLGSPYNTKMPPPNLPSFPLYSVDSHGSSFNIAGPSSSAGTPLTPASSNGDESYRAPTAKMSSSQESPDLRRLSVSSLLSGPPGISYQDQNNGPRSNPDSQDWTIRYQDLYQDTTTYGIDRGFKDLDIGNNDDANAISGSSPIAMRDHLELVLDQGGEFMPVEFGFGMEIFSSTAFENGGYYDKPVPICIPKALEPLPTKLLENSMNLLVSIFRSLGTLFTNSLLVFRKKMLPNNVIYH